MHPNKAFRSTPEPDNLAFAANRGFGILTLAGPDGPLASHIPFVLDGQTLRAHLAKANPILPLLDDPQPALMAVSGPDSYISPDWYGQDDQVPTWNYVAVHLRGSLTKLPKDELHPHLRALSHEFERRLTPKPIWTLDKLSDKMLTNLSRAIVPIKLEIETIDGTWKLNQNKPDDARLAAADAVASAGVGMMMDELAGLMRGS